MPPKEKKPKEPEQTCDICCEKINKSGRKLVSCPFCSKSACLGCQKMFLSSIIRDPHCMHCKTGWNNAFIRNNFPSTWLDKEYKEIREKILLDQELAKIPDTQRFCEAAKRKETLIQSRNDTADCIREK